MEADVRTTRGIIIDAEARTTHGIIYLVEPASELVEFAYIETRYIGKEKATMKKFKFFRVFPYPTSDFTYNVVYETAGQEKTETGKTYDATKKKGNLGKIAESVKITMTPLTNASNITKITHLLVFYIDTGRVMG